MSKSPQVYKVVFHGQNKIFELYARHVGSCDLMGFIEIGDFVFGTHSGVLLDPSEEKLKAEFKGVSASFIPHQAVIRIDKVSHGGTNKILPLESTSNVSQFPSLPKG